MWGVSSHAPLLCLTHAVMHPRVSELKFNVSPATSAPGQLCGPFARPRRKVFSSQCCRPVPAISAIPKPNWTGLLEASYTSNAPSPAFMVLLMVGILVKL